MNDAVVAYVPVLHEGYRRFLESHGRNRPLFVIGEDLYRDYRPLAKDIRQLEPALAAKAIAALNICSAVDVLDAAGAAELARSAPSLVLPAEDISYTVVERFFDRCEVLYDTVFLRWDKTKTVQLLAPRAGRVHAPEAAADLALAAETAALESIDWWRQVGAAMRLVGGEVLTASNEHGSHPLSAYAAGDPRSNFYKGVHLEMSTVVHAEAKLIAEAARDGRSTRGAVMYVTDFPCPPCAKLIAGAGVSRLYFRTGYAVLDGEDILAAAGTEILQVI